MTPKEKDRAAYEAHIAANPGSEKWLHPTDFHKHKDADRLARGYHPDGTPIAGKEQIPAPTEVPSTTKSTASQTPLCDGFDALTRGYKDWRNFARDIEKLLRRQIPNQIQVDTSAQDAEDFAGRKHVERLHKMLTGDNEGALLISDLTEEVQTLRVTLESLYRADTMLRLRICQRAPQIKAFSDWEKHTDAMREAEQALKR